jgi:CMP-N-acetylneuraminic acid synthetase
MIILTIIPARCGSKGVPGKNIKLLGGKPLIYYTIEYAKNAGMNNIVVSTDSEEIASIAKNLNAEVPFLRAKSLASDTTPTIDVIIDLLEQMKLNNYNFDLVCLLQPTVPFRNRILLQNCIEKYEKCKLDSLISVRQVPTHINPHWTFEETDNQLLRISTGEKKIITRRQDLPISYYRDGAVYLTAIDVIMQSKSLYGDRLGYFENKDEEYVNIDTLDDWEKAEKMVLNFK